MESSPVRHFGTPKRVILGSVHNQNNGSPISPMANLKLLTKVATSHISMNEEVNYSIPPTVEAKTPSKYARQLRSLGYICKKFLEYYDLNIPPGQQKQVSLGQLALLLDIEKRRVYDIINIIASLRFASKICKDKYSWYGDQFLMSTLCELKAYALKKNYHQLLSKTMNKNTTHEFINDLNHNSVFDEFDEGCEENKDKQLLDDNRIGALCQKCMMLFLVAPRSEPLNFKMISQIILSKNGSQVTASSNADKTGMRRLYDITNVLESLGLISRTEAKHIKRPAFVYSGPSLPSELNDLVTDKVFLPELEHYSDSSSDAPDSRLNEILEVVSSEIKELKKGIEGRSKASGVHLNARKKLFLEGAESGSDCKGSSGGRFIRAPSSSFRFSGERIMARPPGAPSRPTSTTVVRVNGIARPLPLVKLSLAPIQNGSIYRAVKQGNVITFVKL